MKSLIFITVGQSEAATCGKYTHEILPERQNKDKEFRLSGGFTSAHFTVGNASLAYGYELKIGEAKIKPFRLTIKASLSKTQVYKS